MQELHVRIEFIEDILGTASSDPDIHSRFIASKAEDAPKIEQEVKALGATEVEERGTTVFARNDDGQPILWDYQIKGFFKDACASLRRAGSAYKSSKLKAYKKEIDGLVFIDERQIPFHVTGGEAALCIDECQRPLRASTPQGDRVALAHSETMPAGSWIDITICYLRDDLKAYIEEWLDYGRLRGLGQWRNSGKGRFVWYEINDKGEVIGGNATS